MSGYIKIIAGMDNELKAKLIYDRVKDYQVKAIMRDIVFTSKSEGLIPPVSVQKAAKAGLALRKSAPKSKKGGLSIKEAKEQGIDSGVSRARQLSSGKPVSMATIKKMVSFFARQQKNYNKGGIKAKIAWLLWGGNAGKAWANKIAKSETTSSYSTEADLLEIRHSDWYQYLYDKDIPLASGEYNVVLHKNDYFALGDVVGDSITVYSQGIPKRNAVIPLQLAANILRMSRPLSLREAKFRGRIGRSFI